MLIGRHGSEDGAHGRDGGHGSHASDAGDAASETTERNPGLPAAAAVALSSPECGMSSHQFFGLLQNITFLWKSMKSFETESFFSRFLNMIINMF